MINSKFNIKPNLSLRASPRTILHYKLIKNGLSINEAHMVLDPVYSINRYFSNTTSKHIDFNRLNELLSVRKEFIKTGETINHDKFVSSVVKKLGENESKLLAMHNEEQSKITKFVSDHASPKLITTKISK